MISPENNGQFDADLLLLKDDLSLIPDSVDAARWAQNLCVEAFGIGAIVKVLLVILICFAAFPSDWSCIASLFILVFGTNRGNFRAQMLWMVFYAAIYSAVYFFAIDKVYGLMQMAVILAVPVLRLYNGKRGNSPRINRLMKWVFYLYYPLHLFLIGIMQHLV
jgi:hypothetical protein